MASHASLIRMSACQFKIRKIMIKMIFLPPGYFMASFTGLIGIIFFVDISRMYVFMAINASFANIPEAPPGCLPVTSKAWSGHMSTFQWEFTFIVLFEGIQATTKTIDGMAFRTIWTYPVHGKFSFMVIRMT